MAKSYVLTSERRVLKELYASTDGPNWKYGQYYWVTFMTLDEWTGVKLDNTGCVSTLTLDDCGLYGKCYLRYDKFGHLRTL